MNLLHTFHYDSTLGYVKQPAMTRFQDEYNFYYFSFLF